MAHNNQILINPDGYALPNPGNSITSQWMDKRSAPSVSLSLTFTGSGTPDGYAHIETSDVPEVYGSVFGYPQGGLSPVDASTFPGSTVLITSTGVTKWDLITPARWVRVVYVSVADSSNLKVYCYANAPFSSS